VARVVLEDSAKLQQEDADYLNRRTRQGNDPKVEPLYSPADVPNVTKLWKRVPYKTRTDLGRGVSFTFFDAGHILGSAYVLLEWAEGSRNRSLLFTGDVGRYGSPIIDDPFTLPQPVEHVITESTYGTRDHGPIGEIEPQLLDAIRYCIDRKSRLLAPSFALGRTQSVLWYVQKFVHDGLIPAIPTFVDSPMGVQMTHVHEEFPENYDAETRAMIGKNGLWDMPNLTLATTVEESKRINKTPGPAIIVASSPSCEFGRILHHLRQSIENPDDIVVFVGWVPPGTLGRRLQDGVKRLRILDVWYDVKLQVRTIHGLSAHAGGDELLRFLGPTIRPQTTAYIVHGEADQAEGFARRLLGAGMGRTVVPAMESAVVDGEAPAVAAGVPSEEGE
jgi:metallo-beta-lactamase family protein